MNANNQKPDAEQNDKMSTPLALATILALGAPVAAALAGAGFFLVETPLAQPWPAISAWLGTFVGCVLLMRKLHSILQIALLSAVYSQSVMWLTLGYASLRDSLYRIELVLPILIGAIPAAIIYFRFIAPRDAA